MKTLLILLTLAQPVPFVHTSTVTLDNGQPDRVVCTLESQLHRSYDELVTLAEKSDKRLQVCKLQIAHAETQRPVVIDKSTPLLKVLTWVVVGASIVGAAWAAREATR